MAEIRKPNTMCKNPNCTKGTDGKRKHFYACLSCLRRENWRAYCCCRECYEEYTQIILLSRSQAKKDKFPERTDMSAAEIEAVRGTPMKDIEKYTKETELKDYFEENPDMPLSGIIDKVNSDIEKQAKKTRRKHSD